MTTKATPRRFYIDRDEQHDEPIVRKVSIRRSNHPATHQVESPPANAQPEMQGHHLPLVGKFMQSAIRRRAS